MLQKFFTFILFPIIALPLAMGVLPAAATENTGTMIVGEWLWGSTIADAGADGAEKIISRCADAGVTDIYLLVKGTGGTLGYLNTKYTDRLSRQNRDVLQEAIDAAHAKGIRLHAWICNMEDSAYKAAHSEAGMWHYIRARDNDRINLYDEGYLEYMTTVAAELAAYDIDGLHLDYIRYNHLANGWSEADLSALAAMGANIDRVKELIETTFGYHGRTANSNYIFNAYDQGDTDARLIAQYRRNNVKNYAKEVIDAAKAVNPNLIISAATMPEGAYNEAYGDLHYGQNYSDAAELYDYICPMAYSTSYGRNDSWVISIATNSINKGNRVVMGLQAYDAATTSRLMSEVTNIRSLMKDATFGEDTLGVVLFRNATYDYAKITCDTKQKVVTVKFLTTSQNYRSVQIDAKSGLTIVEASVGDGFKENIGVNIAPNGSNVKFTGTNILSGGTEGYIYIKYEGDLDPDKLQLSVRLFRTEEICTFSSIYMLGDINADPGTPGTFDEMTDAPPADTTAEETASADTTSADETTATHPDDSTPENEGGCASAVGNAIAVIAGSTAVTLTLKRKARKNNK